MARQKSTGVSPPKPSEADGIRRGVAAGAAAPKGRGEVKAAPIPTWEAGMEVTGGFLGLKGITTQYGPSELVEIGFADGSRVTLGAPAILANRLRNVAYGVGVTIRCLGKIATKSGQQAWDFKVWADGVVTE